MSEPGSLNQPEGGDVTKSLFAELSGQQARHLTLAKVTGMSDEELQASYAAACQRLAKNDVFGAGKLFLTLAALDHRQGKYWRGLAICALRSGKHSWADRCFEVALARDPNDVISRVFRAEALIYLHRVADARRELATAIERGAQDKSVETSAYVKRARNVIQLLDAGDQAAVMEKRGG